MKPPSSLALATPRGGRPPTDRRSRFRGGKLGGGGSPVDAGPPRRRRDPTGDEFWRQLHASASAPYRAAGRFAWYFARGKLGRDPVFRELLERGLLPADGRLLDIGCGQALLASLLHAGHRMAAAGQWPAHWGAAPRLRSYVGLELMPLDVARGRAALQAVDPAVQIVCADMCHAELPASDAVVILDVLHYVDHSAQAAVLARVRDALSAGGRLLLRVGDAASQRRYAISQWVDRTVTAVRGHRVPPTWGRPLAEWMQLLGELGFQVEARPMSRGTPFANVLLVCQRTLGNVT